MEQNFSGKSNDSDLLTVQVVRKTQEASDICSFELAGLHGEALPEFSPGAHIDVLTPNGFRRPYSLCSQPGDGSRYLVAILKEAASRGGSKGMHELVQAGETLQISRPRNQFPLHEGAKKHLLLAGGIGVTPILGMAGFLHRAGQDFEMHYCARSKARAAFLDAIGQSGFSSRVQFHFDDGAPSQRLDLPSVLAQNKQPGIHLYVCGPQGFMDAVLGMARESGWSEDHLHYEFFSAAPVGQAGDQPFLVRLATSGKEVLVPPDKSVVDALSEVGVVLPTSCTQGYCGTCITGLAAGIPDHRDTYLTDEEKSSNKVFIPCCSRAGSDCLVLDL